MSLLIAEISLMTNVDAHGVDLLDQAGWHTAHAVVPHNITLMPLPGHAPELNPLEKVSQFMRDHGLSNQVFAYYADIVDRWCTACNDIVEHPWTIMYIDLPDWAHWC